MKCGNLPMEREVPDEAGVQMRLPYSILSAEKKEETILRKTMIQLKVRVARKAFQIRQALTDQSGEGFVDTAIKILMAVVIGALVLAGLYALFDETVLPTLTRRVQEMFNYAG